MPRRPYDLLVARIDYNRAAVTYDQVGHIRFVCSMSGAGGWPNT